MYKIDNSRLLNHLPVSENYLGMAHIIKLFMCVLNPIVPTNDDVIRNGLQKIIQTTNSLYAMLVRILQRKTDRILVASVDRHVKLFLNRYAD